MKKLTHWEESEEWSQRYIQELEYALKHELARMHVSKKREDYEDFLQAGRLLMMEVHQQLHGDPFSQTDRGRYYSFIRNRFRWYLLDHFTKNNRRKEIVEQYEQEERHFQQKVYPQMDWMDAQEYLKFRARLTAEELEVLDLRLNDSDSLAKIAKKSGKSQSWYYKKLKFIRKKYLQFLEEEQQ